MLFVIISFYMFWGLNYKRVSFSNKLKLNTEFKKSDLINFTKGAILEINEKHLEIFEVIVLYQQINMILRKVLKFQLKI